MQLPLDIVFSLEVTHEENAQHAESVQLADAVFRVIAPPNSSRVEPTFGITLVTYFRYSLHPRKSRLSSIPAAVAASLTDKLRSHSGKNVEVADVVNPIDGSEGFRVTTSNGPKAQFDFIRKSKRLIVSVSCRTTREAIGVIGALLRYESFTKSYRGLNSALAKLDTIREQKRRAKRVVAR